MKNVFHNIGYFLKEVKTIVKLNIISNIFSLLSTGFILFILAMVVSGWWISSQIIEVIQGEAEINVYASEDVGNINVLQLVDRIKEIEGVREARMVDEDEAYGRMAEILGKEARVLEYFDDNPFSAFIEVKIHLEEIDIVMEELHSMVGIEYIRDNREVLNRIRDISRVLTFLGYLIIAAVSISTLVIISHIIRQGIYNNKEEIKTLRLLGAPDIFIAFPFLLEGLLLTLGGGLIASSLTVFTLKYIYRQMAGPLPFIPLPYLEAMVPGMVILIMSLSTILGAIGSLFGLSSIKSN